MTASWSLEVLLSPLALSVELLVRVLGLLLCEAKIVVIGEIYYDLQVRGDLTLEPLNLMQYCNVIELCGQ